MVLKVLEGMGLFERGVSNCGIPCHSKLYPLKSGHLAMQLVHALSLFYELKRRNSCYAAYNGATWLRGYMATRLSSKGTARLIYHYMYTVWLYIDIH